MKKRFGPRDQQDLFAGKSATGSYCSKTATQAGERGFYNTRNVRPIAQARRRLRLTQADAAKRCGVSLRTYQRAEAGDVVPMSVKRDIERSLGMRL